MPDTETVESPDSATEESSPFCLDMKVGEAMKKHPKAQFVFASYHLGGCSHCAISEHETIEQVCYGYGIPPDDLLSSLNSLFEEGDDPDIDIE